MTPAPLPKSHADLRVVRAAGYRCQVPDRLDRPCLAPAGHVARVDGDTLAVCLTHLDALTATEHHL